MDFMGVAEPIIDEVRINKKARTALWIGVIVSGVVSIIMFLLYFYTNTLGDGSIKITPSEG